MVILSLDLRNLRWDRRTRGLDERANGTFRRASPRARGCFYGGKERGTRILRAGLATLRGCLAILANLGGPETVKTSEPRTPLAMEAGTVPRQGERYVSAKDRPCLFRGAPRGGVARGRLRPRGRRQQRPREPVALDGGRVDGVGRRRVRAPAVRAAAGLAERDLDQSWAWNRSQRRHATSTGQSHGDGLPGLHRFGDGDGFGRKPLRALFGRVPL